MSKTRKKKELTFEVIEDHEMSQEGFEDVVEMLSEWLWADLQTELKLSSSVSEAGEEPNEQEDGHGS